MTTALIIILAFLAAFQYVRARLWRRAYRRECERHKSTKQAFEQLAVEKFQLGLGAADDSVLDAEEIY